MIDKRETAIIRKKISLISMKIQQLSNSIFFSLFILGNNTLEAKTQPSVVFNHKSVSEMSNQDKKEQNSPPEDLCYFKPKFNSQTSSISLLTILVESKFIEIQLRNVTIFNKTDILESIELKNLESATLIKQERITVKEFEKVYDDIKKVINQLYIKQGYVTSKTLEKDDSDWRSDGVAEITVVEGALEQLEIKGRRRLNCSYIRERLRLGITNPLNIIRLEEQLRLLQLDPLLESVEADLQASNQEGFSKLTVTVKESKTFQSSFSADNFLPPSIGSNRLGVNLSYQNITGLGDKFSLAYYGSTTGGANIVDINYRVPLNPMEGTLQLRATPTWTKITQSPFDELDITGTNQNYEISYRQPLIRSLREEFALSVGFRYQDGRTLGLNRPDLFGSSRSSVVQFSQDYLQRDNRGVVFVSSQMNFGTGLFEATDNAGSIPDGQFFSWVGQIQRLQRISDRNLLILQGSLQLTPDSMLPDYLFYIGGGQSVRGYRTNARSGDNGIRFSLEDRITLVADKVGAYRFQIVPFLDLGYIWNSADNPTQLPPNSFLIGPGLGIVWEPIKDLSLRLDYGVPIINLGTRGDSLQDDGFYFQVNYQVRF